MQHTVLEKNHSFKMLKIFAQSFLLLLLVTSFQSTKAQDATSNPNSDDFTCGPLQLINHDFAFTEGPVSDKAGNVFFTDQPNNRIWEYDIKGQLSIFMEPAGRANGMDFDQKGNLVVCADEHNEIWSIGRDKKKEVLLKSYNGKLLNGPNDLWIDAHGGIYFTDPYYQRKYWTRKSTEQDKPCVYYLPKGAKKAIRVSELLQKPNGLVGSADGRYLYVADIEGHKIYRFETGKKGRLTNPVVLIDQGADGITADQNGHLYLSGNGVFVFNSEGQLLKHIPVDEPWVANLGFGGKEHKQLFITASKGLYVLPTNQTGLTK